MIRAAQFFLFFCLIASIAQAQDTAQKIVSGRVNAGAQMQKPYVILISADGFRYDLADKYDAVNLRRLRKKGVTAKFMQPSFPSLTFPNHYSIATGLYPTHHGIVDNSFYDEKKQAIYRLGDRKAVGDSSWYGGTPLWVLAEKQQMISASFYWVASESAIQGVRPTYYYNYNEAINIGNRIATVKNWLQLPEEKRPHLITFYFPQVDHQEHYYGPDSKHAGEAVSFVDSAVGALVRTVDSLGLPVNYIFLSDHGMTSVDTVQTIPLPAVVDTSRFIIPSGLTLVHLYAKDKSYVVPTYAALKNEAKDYDVYLADSLPAAWHYSKVDDRFGRTGDIILVPHYKKMFVFSKRHLPAAEHGYDPSFEEMHATFYAWGPAFKRHKTINGFENVHVYPLVAKILGLTYDESVDGKLDVLQSILRK